MYLTNFILPIEEEKKIIEDRMAYNGGLYGYIDNTYPCGLFGKRDFSEIGFSPVTIFYGGNGSGKSTLLNLIAHKLKLNRIAPYNSSELFGEYVGHCRYVLGYDDEGFPRRIPDGSRILTSDDVFDYMLTVRTNNEEIAEGKEDARDEWSYLKFGKTIKMKSLDDYEALHMQVMARSKSISRRQFIKRTVGEETGLASNGETAMRFFHEKLKNDKLYLLDEPENSLSPKLQFKLVDLLTELSRYCGCQLVIATHSPFILAIEDARIYDLDSRPVRIRNWWELENTRDYFDFFYKNRKLFLTEDKVSSSI